MGSDIMRRAGECVALADSRSAEAIALIVDLGTQPRTRGIGRARAHAPRIRDCGNESRGLLPPVGHQDIVVLLQLKIEMARPPRGQFPVAGPSLAEPR